MAKGSSSSKPAPSVPSPSVASGALHTLWKAYNDQTPDRLKFIDAFLVFIMLSGVVQFLYCVLVTNFPFNAFLAGYAPFRPQAPCAALTVALCFHARFSSTIGQFVLTASLRSQVNPENRAEFKEVSPERCVSHLFMRRHTTAHLSCSAFADFALGSIVLHFFVYNFLG